MNKERLLKLADFLDVLPGHKFDFSTYVNLGTKDPKAAYEAPDEHCGTTACAMGWTPIVFPDDFEWVKDDRHPKTVWPVLKTELSRDFDATDRSGQKFFEINEVDYDYLFIPGYGLEDTATAKEVAAHIREFVKTGQRTRKAKYKRDYF